MTSQKARRNTLSPRHRDTEVLFIHLQALRTAKANGSIIQVWEALDDIAGHALWCETYSVRVRFLATLEAHRSEYRTEGCTSDQFACLDSFWDLPKRA